MKRSLIKFHDFLIRQQYLVQVAIFYLLTYLVAIPTALLDGTAGSNAGPKDDVSALLAVAVAPIIETLIFQYAIFRIMALLKLKNNKYLWMVIVSALVFGLGHYYSIQYIVFATAVGVVLGYTYYFYINDPSKAFWTTTLIHFLRNGTAAVVIYVFHVS